MLGRSYATNDTTTSVWIRQRQERANVACHCIQFLTIFFCSFSLSVYFLYFIFVFYSFIYKYTSELPYASSQSINLFYRILCDCKRISIQCNVCSVVNKYVFSMLLYNDKKRKKIKSWLRSGIFTIFQINLNDKKMPFFNVCVRVFILYTRLFCLLH